MNQDTIALHPGCSAIFHGSSLPELWPPWCVGCDHEPCSFFTNRRVSEGEKAINVVLACNLAILIEKQKRLQIELFTMSITLTVTVTRMKKHTQSFQDWTVQTSPRGEQKGTILKSYMFLHPKSHNQETLVVPPVLVLLEVGCLKSGNTVWHQALLGLILCSSAAHLSLFTAAFFAITDRSFLGKIARGSKSQVDVHCHLACLGAVVRWLFQIVLMVRTFVFLTQGCSKRDHIFLHCVVKTAHRRKKSNLPASDHPLHGNTQHCQYFFTYFVSFTALVNVLVTVS